MHLPVPQRLSALADPVNDGVRSPHGVFGVSNVTSGELVSTSKVRSALERSVSEMRERVTVAVARMQEQGLARADIEVYEIAKHYELRAGHKLAPMAFEA